MIKIFMGTKMKTPPGLKPVKPATKTTDTTATKDRLEEVEERLLSKVEETLRKKSGKVGK